MKKSHILFKQNANYWEWGGPFVGGHGSSQGAWCPVVGAFSFSTNSKLETIQYRNIFVFIKQCGMLEKRKTDMITIYSSVPDLSYYII